MTNNNTPLINILDVRLLYKCTHPTSTGDTVSTCQSTCARMHMYMHIWTAYHQLTTLLVVMFNGPFSRTTQVNQYQKGKTNLDFTGATDSEWQWHQLGHRQVCTSLRTDNHTSTPPLSFYRPDALPATQPTASKH